jgi:hypothetical protein
MPSQNNGAIVRQVVGYDRFVGEHAYRQLTELYRALRLYVNCYQPSMKLQSKLQEGKKVRCVYDPAKTPLQRLLPSGVLSVQKQQELIEVAQALDPLRLFQQLEQLQKASFAVLSIMHLLFQTYRSRLSGCFPSTIVQRERNRLRGASPIRQPCSTPCTKNRRGENVSWAGDVPRKTHLKVSGNTNPVLVGCQP